MMTMAETEARLKAMGMYPERCFDTTVGYFRKGEPYTRYVPFPNGLVRIDVFTADSRWLWDGEWDLTKPPWTEEGTSND